MDSTAMFSRNKQVPEDVGLRNTAADESGGQGQLHRDEKEHKPVIKKVKDKVKKIKKSLTGHSKNRDHGDNEHGRDEPRADYDDDGSDEEEEGDAALEREAAMEQGGYMDDVEDKTAPMESDPEVHGAPMYESERAPAVQSERTPAVESERIPPVQELVSKYDPARAPAAQEARGADAPGARFGDLGGPGFHQPAAQEARGGPAVHDTAAQGARRDEDHGVRFSDIDGPAVHDPAAQGAQRDDSPKVRLGDLGGPVVEDPAAPRSTTPAAREGEDIGTTPVIRDFESMTLSDDPSHVGAGKTGARAEEWKDAAADKMGAGDNTTGGATYTDKLKNAAAVPTEYSKKLASTVYEKVAGVGSVVGAGGKRDDGERADQAVPVSDAGADGKEWKDAPAAVDATDRSSGPGYTDKIKSTAAGTAEYGKQLASTVYDKVAGVGTAVTPSLRPQVGAGKTEEAEERSTAMPVSDVGVEGTKDATATDATNSASGPGYTEKIKSAAAGTTEYGKQLASTVYEKVAGVSTAVVGKVQQATQSAVAATPGVGAQQDTTASPTPGVTGYISEKLRPGDEERSLSSAISSAVQRRKEVVGGTVGQRVPAPTNVITKAREAVSSLTGGNRASEAVAVQPTTTAGGEDSVAVAAAEEPVRHGEEEIGDRKLNTNTI